LPNPITIYIGLNGLKSKEVTEPNPFALSLSSALN